MSELHWSPSEKALARKAFNLALQREFEATIQQAKEKAGGVKEISQLWNLEAWLCRRREEIDRTYDYRYSMLPIVFANLLRRGRLNEEELSGLGEDKLGHIRAFASFR